MRIARVARPVDGLAGDVAAEGEGREHRVALPGGAEGGRPLGATVDAPGLVDPLEAAAAEAAEEDVLAEPEHGQVDPAVAVDVERVGAGHLGQVRRRVRQDGEPQRAARRAVVVVQGRRVRAAGEVELGAPVVVAVEDGDAAADEERELAVVGVLDAGGGRLLHEPGRRHRLCRPGRPGQRGRGEGHPQDGEPDRGPAEGHQGDPARATDGWLCVRHARIEAHPGRSDPGAGVAC